MNELLMPSPIGRLLLEEDGAGLCAVRRLADERQVLPESCESALLLEAQRQIGAYFDRRLTVFDLPLSMRGTAFEQSVWQALTQIPFGRVMSYGALAALLGKPKASRAVGGACSRNPLLIVVPCHRVIAGTGRLTGFAAGLDAKRTLLMLEGHVIADDRMKI